MPSCDHLYACDARWWKHHIEHITRDYEGICWTQHVAWDMEKIDPAAWGIKVLRSENKQGLSRTPGVIHQGQNSGYQAIGLAYGELKADRILLLGYDMQTDGDKRHWFGAHPKGLEVGSSYPCFIRMFETIKPADYGIEIWNVTRKTALQHFPVMNLDEVCRALS